MDKQRGHQPLRAGGALGGQVEVDEWGWPGAWAGRWRWVNGGGRGLGGQVELAGWGLPAQAAQDPGRASL